MFSIGVAHIFSGNLSDSDAGSEVYTLEKKLHKIVAFSSFSTSESILTRISFIRDVTDLLACLCFALNVIPKLLRISPARFSNRHFAPLLVYTCKFPYFIFHFLILSNYDGTSVTSCNSSTVCSFSLPPHVCPYLMVVSICLFL